MDIYCVKCKSKTDSSEFKERITKNKKRMIMAICGKCGSKKGRFIKQNADISELTEGRTFHDESS